MKNTIRKWLGEPEPTATEERIADLEVAVAALLSRTSMFATGYPNPQMIAVIDRAAAHRNQQKGN